MGRLVNAWSGNNLSLDLLRTLIAWSHGVPLRVV